MDWIMLAGVVSGLVVLALYLVLLAASILWMGDDDGTGDW